MDDGSDMEIEPVAEGNLIILLDPQPDPNETEPPHDTKPHSQQSLASTVSVPVPSHEDDDDGTICSICLESWTNCGDHRICSLKCGHLFGYKCITRWLELQSKKTCPTCKKPVRRVEIRFIYAKKLVAVDYAEVDCLKQQLAKTLADKHFAESSICTLRAREKILQMEIEELKSRVSELSCMAKHIDSRNPFASASKIRLYLEKNLDICKTGCRNCRVFDVSVPQDMIMVASNAPGGLFSGGYGLRKFNLSTYRSITFAPLYKAPIRDLCMDSTDQRILTVSIEKKFKIVDTHTASTISNVDLEASPWACSWDPCNTNQLIIGSQSGTTLIYDTRNLGSSLNQLSIPGDLTPVVSVAAIKEDKILLVGKLNSLWAFESQADGTYSRHLLPLEGPFLSVKYNQETKQVLVTSRLNSHTTFNRHYVCHLEKQTDPDVISSNTVYTFKGGSVSINLMGKTSCFAPGNVVAAHHTSRKSILLYSLTNGEEIGTCPTHDNAVLDVKGIETSQDKFLIYLNEKRMEFFKFNTC